MIRLTWSPDGDGGDGGSGGDEEDVSGIKAVKWRRSASNQWTVTAMLLFFLITGSAAVLSNSTFKGEQQSDINARIGQSAFLPCELEPNNVTMGFEVTTQCGIVHSVKWYRGASRIFLYSGGPRVVQPHREGYTDRYDRSYWSIEPNSTLGFLVMDNITALDEAVYKCEITYTKVHEGCNIVQFINLTTYTDPESISVGILAEPGDPSKHNYIDPTSDFYDDKNSNPKFGIMKKLTSGTAVGPVDEGNKIRLVCRAGRARPVPQVTWWQHNRGPIDDDDLIDYQYRKVDSDMSDDYFSYSGLWVAQSVLTVVGRRGANGKYECRVKTATDSSPVLTSNVDVTVNVSPFSVEMSTSSSGSTVTTISKVDEHVRKSQKGEHGRNAEEVVYAETTEGQPLVIRCAARGARPQANVTWYYYYKDQENDNDDFGGGTRNDLNVRASPVQPSKLSKHGAPVMLGNSHQNGSSTARSPSDYLISEQRRIEGGAEIIGPVEIAQHTEYQADGTRDTHSQLSMSQLHRQQDGSILRCDAYNNVGSSPSQPLTVNMTIRVKYVPTAWVVPVTDAENSGAVIEDEMKNEVGQQQHGGADGNGANANDDPKTSNDGLRYQANLYTVVVNETRELRLQCAYHANPDKLRTPVKWYRDGVELQLIDEDEQSSASYKSENAPVNSRFRVNAVGNAPKHARVKQSTNGNGDGNGEDATVLLVRRLTRFDSGRYECRVRNSVGAANSTNFANVHVQYTPKVKLHVILDDAFDEDQTSPMTTSSSSSSSSNVAAGSNPVVLESQHRNVTLRCAVQLEQDQHNVDDDPSLNLTSVHWYWNGVQMQLPNCTRSSDPGDVFEDEDDVDDDADAPSDNENNGMNVNYYTSETQGDEDYDTYAVDNDTARRRNKKQRKVLCTDRELILINVTKNIHGNYSCRARNAAGLLTPMSDQTPLIVYFAPGPVTLEFTPRQVIKGKNVTLRCNAQYLGRPQHPTRYSWFRDGHQIYHQNQIVTNPNGNNGGGNFNPEWFVDHVSLETRANFTCSAYNEGGVTYSEPVYIEVFAPPNYIIGPPQYLGVVYNATHVNASCTVECYPHCSVYWLRRGVQIDPINNPSDKQGYTILTEYLPAERLKNDFEAVRSTLIWRMENNWPRGLDPITDSTEYSCRSSGNDVGPPVSESIMNFSVEYPPGNMTVSKTAIHVSEGNIPEKVFCHAEGRPQPTFEWRYIGSVSNWIVPGNSSQPTQPSSQQKILSVANSGNGGGAGGNVGGGSGSGNSQINNQQLVLNSAVSRQQAGYYACVARNMHGNGTAHTYLDVMYKPSCQLRMLTVDQLKQETSSVTDQSSESGTTAELDEFLSSSAGEKRILVCTATANPGHVQYTWTIRNSGRINDTSAASSSMTSDSVAAERIITVAIGGSSANGGSMEADNVGLLNRSVLILQDTLEVSSNEEGDGRDNDNVPNKGEGVRTYVCTVNNTVGWDQCTIHVQGDAPWWKQLLTSVGLGGLPIMVVLVALVVILLLIIIVTIVLLLMFVCKNRYIKPGNGMTGRRQKYVKQKYPTLTTYKVPVVWRRHRGHGLNTSKVRQNPEGSATSIPGANQHAVDRSANVGAPPKPPPGYGDDNNSSAESFSGGAAAAVGKWPLKPGVLVHSKQQLLKSPTAGAALRQPNGGDDVRDPVVGGDDKTLCKSKNRAKSTAAECVTLTNETQSARAARIRRMMIGSNNNNNINGAQKRSSPALPPPAPPVRKHPDVDIVAEKKTCSPAATSDSRGGPEQQDNESNLGAAGDSKAAFYENLPFHGMRPPPNQSSVSTVQEQPPSFSSSSPPRTSIRRSPNGGYVSLLRRAGPAAVRFDSLQRPNRGTTVFRSMRTAAVDTTDARRRPSRSSSSAAAVVVAAGSRKSDASAATLPKPAPRTRIPSAAVAPPSLARRRDVYENLQQLLNSSDVGDVDGKHVQKLTGIGIGARSLDEFYRMQIQQQQQQQSLYHRVMSDDAAATVLTIGYPTGGEPHRGQQSIEMTQFEVTADSSSSCQKPQNAVIGRYNNNNNSNSNNNNSNCIVTTERDGDDDDDDDNEARSKSMTVDRRRRASRQALDGGGTSLTEHYFNVKNPYQQQHRGGAGTGGRRGNANGNNALLQLQSSVRSAANSYNTIASGGYYAGPGLRQQQAKRPPQRSYCGDDALVADEQDPTSKRSSARRPQNRRRRAGEPAGCVDPDAEPRAPSPTDAARPQDHRHHHHGGRPRQPPKNDNRGGDPPVPSAAEQPNGNNAGSANKNVPYKPAAASGYAESVDLEYADVDYRTLYYDGPISYKQSS